MPKMKLTSQALSLFRTICKFINVPLKPLAYISHNTYRTYLKRCLTRNCVRSGAKWSCKCFTVISIFLFILFWCFIIFYASRRDRPLDILVSDTFVLPEMKSATNKHNSRIPLLFHQMWKSPDIPEKWKSAHEGCMGLNSEYQLILWTDEMIYNFIWLHYPWFYSVFVGYPYHIQRVDVARYFILYHYGGVYLDIDAACNTPFRDIVENMTSEESVLLPMTDIYGVTNSFMVSSPKSDFFRYVIYELPNFAHGEFNLIRHTTIIFSTGPMFMSHCVTTFSRPTDIHVMSLSDYDEKHFYHAKGGSWHSMDTEIVDMFHFHYVELLIFVFIIVCVILVYRYIYQYDSARALCYRFSKFCPFHKRPLRQYSQNGRIRTTSESLSYKMQLGQNSE